MPEWEVLFEDLREVPPVPVSPSSVRGEEERDHPLPRVPESGELESLLEEVRAKYGPVIREGRMLLHLVVGVANLEVSYTILTAGRIDLVFGVVSDDVLDTIAARLGHVYEDEFVTG